MNYMERSESRGQRGAKSTTFCADTGAIPSSGGVGVQGVRLLTRS